MDFDLWVERLNEWKEKKERTDLLLNAVKILDKEEIVIGERANRELSKRAQMVDECRKTLAREWQHTWLLGDEENVLERIGVLFERKLREDFKGFLLEWDAGERDQIFKAVYGIECRDHHLVEAFLGMIPCTIQCAKGTVYRTVHPAVQGFLDIAERYGVHYSGSVRQTVTWIEEVLFKKNGLQKALLLKYAEKTAERIEIPQDVMGLAVRDIYRLFENIQRGQ